MSLKGLCCYWFLPQTPEIHTVLSLRGLAPSIGGGRDDPDVVLPPRTDSFYRVDTVQEADHIGRWGGTGQDLDVGTGRDLDVVIGGRGGISHAPQGIIGTTTTEHFRSRHAGDQHRVYQTSPILTPEDSSSYRGHWRTLLMHRKVLMPYTPETPETRRG